MNKIEEIPFKSSPQTRLIPWIIALMCYLAILALGLATSLNNTLSDLQQSLEQSLTVELTSSYQGLENKGRDTFPHQQKLQALLKRHTKIERFEPLSFSLLHSLIPSEDKKAKDPLFTPPYLLDVYPKAGRQIDPHDLENYLGRFLQGVKVYQVYPDKKELMSLGWHLLTAVLIFASLIVFIAAAIIMFTTHTGLSLHKETLSILRLIGANNAFIFKRFQKYAASLALQGGFGGLILGMITFGAFLGGSLFQDHVVLLLILLITPLLLTFLTFGLARVSFTFTLDT